MADYSTLYPTLSRSKNGVPSYGSSGSADSLDMSTPSSGSLSGLNDSWDQNGNFTGPSNVEGMDNSGFWGGAGGAAAAKGIASFAPLALSLFAPKDNSNVPGAIKGATDAATQLGKQGAATSAQGAEALNPVLHYLAAVTSGDPQALLAATAPQRRKVIDQYDSARQAAQFSPRGGGTSSAVVNANTREAGDLSQIGMDAQSEGMKTAAAVGEALTGQGANAQSASVQHLTQLLQPLMQNKATDQESIFKTFSSIAGMMALFI